MASIEIGHTYILTIAPIGQFLSLLVGTAQAVDLIAGIKSYIEDEDNFVLDKPYFIGAVPAKDVPQVPGQPVKMDIALQPFAGLHALAENNVTVSRTAIRMVLIPKPEVLSHYQHAKSGLITTNQMPPKNLNPQFLDQAIKKGT